jgi:ring-1,2-phenylacetyl-CoA epoxidase subunit PaaE
VTQFHSLVVKDIRRETPDCVSIAFDVPEQLAPQFRFVAGQNVTLRVFKEGEELRRSYSICSSPLENELRVAVKRQDFGKFSSFANEHLNVGDKIDVLPPSGRFILHLASSGAFNNKNYLAFAAGSGITPIISIIKTILATEPESNFTLIYGNRNRASIIFREELEALKNRYMNRLGIHHILSREETDAPINHGRIDASKCELIAKYFVDIFSMDNIFLCGPEEMIFGTRKWLEEKGVAPERIHFELFTVPGETMRKQQVSAKSNIAKTSRVKIKLDGIAFTYDLPFDGSSILEGGLRQGADLPYACKGGVCATCRAKLLKGEVEMDNNYALEEEELAAGFILTCQSHPRSAEVEVDYDARA